MIKTVGLYKMVDNDIDLEWIAEDLIGKVAELVKGYITVKLGEPTPAGMYAGASIKIIVPEDGSSTGSIPAAAQDDPVNHPAHYTDGMIETIDYIEDKKLDYHLGNAVKYISRAGKKDKSKEIEDLEKAVWYINRKIKKLKEAADGGHEASAAENQI